MFLLKFRLYFATGFSAALYHSQFLPISIYLSIVWSAVATFIIVKIISIFTSIRVEERAEAIGLDDSEHEETAYPTFMGMDS